MPRASRLAAATPSASTWCTLPITRDAIARQLIGEVQLPQRPTTIQRGAGNLSDHLIEFAAAAGWGNPHLP